MAMEGLLVLTSSEIIFISLSLKSLLFLIIRRKLFEGDLNRLRKYSLIVPDRSKADPKNQVLAL